MWVFLLLAYKGNQTLIFPAYTSLAHCQKAGAIINDNNRYDRTVCEPIMVIKEKGKK